MGVKPRVWKILVVVGLVVVLSLLGYRWLSRRSFASRLSDYKVTFVRSSIPGKPVVETTVTSGGALVKEETINDQVQSRVATKLKPEAMDTVRHALANLALLPSHYKPPVWDRATDHQYLWLKLTLQDGDTKEITLENTTPLAVQRLIETINSSVGNEFRIRYPKR